MRKFPRLALVAISMAALLMPLVAQTKSTEAGARKVQYDPIPSGTYRLDPAHSLIGFSIQHLSINWVDGRFNDFEGTIAWNSENPALSKVSFTAQVESIDTAVEARDKHLRSDDFFAVETHPEMSFSSTKITPGQGKEHVMEGDLTIKGVTKRVSFPFALTGAITGTSGETRIGVEAATTLDRTDFGIDYGNVLPNGGLAIGHQVNVRLQLEAILAEDETEK